MRPTNISTYYCNTGIYKMKSATINLGFTGGACSEKEQFPQAQLPGAAAAPAV